MPAPPLPANPLEIEIDPEDLVADAEPRTNSQTRRLGSNVSAGIELDATVPATSPLFADDLEVVDLEGLEDDVGAAGEGPKREAKPAHTPYLAGDVIDDKYRLSRIIGRGGMGAVWQAHNIPLDIDVAIKLIRRDRTAPGAASRLLTEARAAARLMHPAIVRVFDFGETDQGDPFIVMELLHGESLSAILRRKKRLTPAVAVQTMLPVAAALASAHGKGIVHRDLKPDNIIVVTDESGSLVPKIVDFGIAKLLSPDFDRQVTLAGEVLGSPDYMSPEQARGADNVGEGTDIWAFSVVLHELVTGRRPFDGANYNALIASILTDEPPPMTAHGVGDAALSGIVQHGLAKDLAVRWPRMRDLGASLASWAVAAGIEDDVMGNSIAKQWLSGGARRLLTVQPETGAPRLHSGLVEAPPSSQWATPSPGALHSSPPGPRHERRASAERALLLVIAILLTGATGVGAFLMRDRIGRLRHPADAAPQETAASVEATAPSALVIVTSAPTPATALPSAAPVASASSADASATAAPAGSGHAGPFKAPRRTKAPAAPRNIRF